MVLPYTNNKIYYLDCNKFPEKVETKQANQKQKKKHESREHHLIGLVNGMNGGSQRKGNRRKNNMRDISFAFINMIFSLNSLRR